MVVEWLGHGGSMSRQRLRTVEVWVVVKGLVMEVVGLRGRGTTRLWFWWRQKKEALGEKPGKRGGQTLPQMS